AKSTHKKIKASDIDPEAVAMAQKNSYLNHVRHLVQVYESDGFNRLERGQKTFDIIVANILSNTLKRLANDLTNRLSPPLYPNRGGSLILSGVLNKQQQQITATMRQFGLCLQEKIILDEWTTLCFRR
ncbi:MAG: 50S ribosomal protein L11 methyltransferase, partial [Pseudomonadota bacterium]|nr:50S ribosomal protein L11 methyltransferase [Pseudomonadota bacterium]